MKKHYLLSPKTYNLKPNSGSITAPLLIISTSFIIVIYGLIFLLSNQLDLTFRQTASDQSLYIAEAGINYYRWHLSHSPNIFTDNPDTNCKDPNNNPCHFYKDPQGKTIGKYTLEITPPSNGSSTVDIISTGFMDGFENTKRTIKASYGIQSLTRFSHLSNASTWYGSGITINGLIHSNTGIRMDGINTSLVTSAQEDYKCGQDTGCSPTQTKPGVWGSGPNSYLWKYPVPPIDFDSILFDFSTMKNGAIENGLYLEDAKKMGYHIVFKSNGTFDLFLVTQTDSNHAYSINEGCRRWYSIIKKEDLINNYSVQENPVIFAENDVWVDGIVNGKITIGVASFPLQSKKVNIWINNNITYLAKDGNHTLGLIAQDDIFFGRDIPDNYEIDAALMAQNGKVMRHGYLDNCGENPYSVRNSLTIYGSIISNEKSYWNYGSEPLSGFRIRTITYDSNLLYNPPPYFPTNGEYELINWEEI